MPDDTTGPARDCRERGVPVFDNGEGDRVVVTTEQRSARDPRGTVAVAEIMNCNVAHLKVRGNCNPIDRCTPPVCGHVGDRDQDEPMAKEEGTGNMRVPTLRVRGHEFGEPAVAVPSKYEVS